VEPSFATALPGGPEDAIHGVALLLPIAEAARLDAQERSYSRAQVTISTYDGRELVGFLYTSKTVSGTVVDTPCSARYLNILVTGF